jgi:hypothetical protein
MTSNSLHRDFGKKAQEQVTNIVLDEFVGWMVVKEKDDSLSVIDSVDDLIVNGTPNQVEEHLKKILKDER